jgi:two-component sensor histidine kinase
MLTNSDTLDKFHRLLRWGLRPGSPGAILFAIGCVAAALGVRLLFSFFRPDLVIFATYYPAVLLATLIGGVSAGSVALVLGGLVGWLWFEPSLPLLSQSVTEQVTGLVLYGMSSSFIVWAAEHYRLVIRRLDEEQHYRRLVVDELNHRLRNKLATVHAVLRHELQSDDAIRDKIIGRLRALSAADELLARPDGAAVDLGGILQAELMPYDETRIAVSGEPIRVPPKPAAMLALVFHELATNAAKYGALAGPQGRVSISWSMSAKLLLRIEWSESGGPAVIKPVRQGFGTKLFTRALDPFHGTVEAEFHPAGLQCRIALALDPEVLARPESFPPVPVPSGSRA